MDKKEFTAEDLILASIRGEIESHDVYITMAGKVKNAFLRDRLHFLANEEVKHRYFLEDLYKKEYPDKEFVVPARSPVPIPHINVDKSSVHVSELIESAMGAEKAAHDFYISLASMFEDKAISSRLEYLARMELGHYRLLEHELKSIQEFEDYIDEWPMMHAGP